MSKERPPEPLDFFIWTVEVYFSFTLFLFNSLDFIGSCVRSCHYSHNCDHCSDIIIIILTASNFSDFDRDGNLWLWWLIVQVFFFFSSVFFNAVRLWFVKNEIGVWFLFSWWSWSIGTTGVSPSKFQFLFAMKTNQEIKTHQSNL